MCRQHTLGKRGGSEKATRIVVCYGDAQVYRRLPTRTWTHQRATTAVWMPGSTGRYAPESGPIMLTLSFVVHDPGCVKTPKARKPLERVFLREIDIERVYEFARP
jgi:hypothetical protein